MNIAYRVAVAAGQVLGTAALISGVLLLWGLGWALLLGGLLILLGSVAFEVVGLGLPGAPSDARRRPNLKGAS